MAGEIDIEIVRADLADVPDLSRFTSALAPDERARADGYKISESRNAFSLARGLLRLELSKRLGCAPLDICFDLRASGKPDLRAMASRPDWRFSVSHTGSHVALAFALGSDVGIDIERLDRRVNPLDIARRYFTASELRVLEAATAEQRDRAFLAGWTRKEAIVKARGTTMADSLTTLRVDLDPSATHPSYEDAQNSGRSPCRLTAFEWPPTLIGAVAVNSTLTPCLHTRVLSGGRFD